MHAENGWDLKRTFSVILLLSENREREEKSLTGSSSLKAREKKRMKSTADVLVMVYLRRHRYDQLEMGIRSQHDMLEETNLQADSDEEQAPVGQSNIQSCGQSWVPEQQGCCETQALH